MKLRLLFIAIIITSCQNSNLKKVDETALIKQELESINWNAVDEYPSFKTCDTLSGSARETCFKSTLIHHFNSTLSQAKIVVTRDLSDTLLLRLQIDSLGAVSVADIKAKATTRQAIPQIDSLIQDGILSLPKVYPAIKHSQKVRTEFTLPLVVSIK